MDYVGFFILHIFLLYLYTLKAKESIQMLGHFQDTQAPASKPKIFLCLKKNNNCPLKMLNFLSCHSGYKLF